MTHGLTRRRRRDYWTPEKTEAHTQRLVEKDAEHAAFIANLPAEMPPMPEWSTPWKHRQGQIYADRVALRRARLAGAETGRPVIRHEIIARDKSTCWICLRVLPENEIHLDHVTPLSKGGKHDPDNVKVTCAPCNLWKGSRIITLILGA